jgi:hypothetical protein
MIPILGNMASPLQGLDICISGQAVARSSFSAPSITILSASSGKPRRDRRRRTDIAKGRSVRSGGSVLTTLSCSASGIFVICYDLTQPTTTARLAGTFRSTRTRRRREQFA